jgi:error-prone DNA polymerase
MVAAGDVHMDIRRRRALQDTMTAIRHNTTIAEAGAFLFRNGERHIRTRGALEKVYAPALLDETVRIAERCRFSLDELKYHYPSEVVPEGHTPATWLRSLTEEGIRWRWPEGVADKVRGQIEHELRLIRELDYEPYFLTVHDIVRFARGQGILRRTRQCASCLA